MKSVVNGQLASYIDEGKGRTIVMLHGWGSNLHTFDDLAHNFAKSYRVIRLDWPGFGDSPIPVDNWTISDYAQFLSEFLQKQNVKNVHAIIIHSFGGRVAIKALSQGLIQTNNLVLIGSGGIRHSAGLKQKLYKTVAKVGKSVTNVPGLNKLQGHLRQKLYQSAGASDYLNSGNMRAIFLNAVNEDLQEDAKDINCRTLLVWGENDQETPLSDARIFHKKIKNSELYVVSGAGHFTHTDEPGEVLHRIEGFL